MSELQKIPPHSAEAEQHIIGAILIEPDSILKAAEIVQPEDFYRDAHKIIYCACLDIYRHDEINLVSLPEYLKTNDNLEKCGGVSYLAALVESTPTAANIAYYARLVKKKSIQRRIKYWGANIQQQIDENQAEDLPAFFSDMEKALVELAEPLQTKRQPDVNSILESIKTRWRKEKDGTRKFIATDDKFDSVVPRYVPGHLWIIGGYCLGKGTEIILATGERKKVEELKIGDKLMPVFTNKPPEICGLNTGQDMLYQISGKYIKSVVVNSKHILPVKGVWNKKIYFKTAKELFNLSFKGQAHYRLLREPAQFEKGKYIIPPYLLGLWLGDGTASKPDITLHEDEKEIMEYLQEYTKEAGYSLKVRRDMRLFNNKILTASIIWKNGGDVKSREKAFVNKLRGIGIYKNKNIPTEYLKGVIEDRLELLAGLIDTDGSLTGAGKTAYAIYQSNLHLISQIKELVESVGLNATLKEKKQTVTHILGRKIKANRLWRLTISGNTNCIPVKVNRKKIKKQSKKNVDGLTFKIEKIGIGEFYGFELTGNKLFLAQDYIVHHNTSAGKSTLLAQMITDVCKAGAKTVIFSMEDSREDKMMKLLANLAYIGQTRLMVGDIEDEHTQKKLSEAEEILRQWGLYIYDDVYNVDDMRLKIKKHKLQGGADVVCVDFIQNIGGKGTLYERISEAIIKLQKMARELEVTMIVVSQVSNEGMRSNSEIIGLKGAGELSAAADIILWLKRVKGEGNEKSLDCEIKKNRPFGKTGMVPLCFNEMWSKISRRGF